MFWKSPAIFALLASLVVVGCSESGPELATVQGKVTMDGKPLPEAAVTFFPEGGRPASARTDENGEYVLEYTADRQGAIAGKQKVQIRTYSNPGTDADGKLLPSKPETVPVQYNDKSTLEFVVEEGKKNIANFDLESKGEIGASGGY